MLIKVFRSDFSFQILIIALLAVLLWLNGFLHPIPMPSSDAIMPFYDLIKNVLGNISWLITSIGLILVLAEAVLLNLILTNHDMAPRNSALPAILYLMLMSWSPSVLTLHPALFVNAFLIIFLYYFLKVHEQKDAFKEVFSATLTLSLATFFDLPIFILFLLVWIGFMVYRTFTWREWVISVIGFFVPLLFAAVYYFLIGNLSTVIAEYVKFFRYVPHFNYHFNWITAAYFSAFILLSSWSILNIINVFKEKIITIRKNFTIMIWFFIIAIPIILFSGNDFEYQSTILAIPAATIMAFYFSMVKKLRFLEILFACMALALILLRIR